MVIKDILSLNIIAHTNPGRLSPNSHRHLAGLTIAARSLEVRTLVQLPSFNSWQLTFLFGCVNL